MMKRLRNSLRRALYVYHYCFVFVFWKLFHARIRPKANDPFKKRRGNDFLYYIKTPTIWNYSDHTGGLNPASILITLLLFVDSFFYIGLSVFSLVLYGVVVLYFSFFFRGGATHVSFLCLGEEYVQYFTSFHRAPVAIRKRWLVICALIYSLCLFLLLFMFVINAL